MNDLMEKYKELKNYTEKDNKAIPQNWLEIEKIIHLNKIEKTFYHHYCCYVLAYAHTFNLKQKIERFHKQLKYGVFWSHNPNAYIELKNYLCHLKRQEWIYIWPDSKCAYIPKNNLNS